MLYFVHVNVSVCTITKLPLAISMLSIKCMCIYGCVLKNNSFYKLHHYHDQSMIQVVFGSILILKEKTLGFLLF